MSGGRRVLLATVTTLAAAALAACGGASSPPPAPLQGAAPRPTVTTPSPSIRWVDNGFDTTGLPAVAVDGSHVVYAAIGEDGARGYPNLAIVVKDRTDVELRRVVVLATDEVDAMFGEHGPVPALRARIAEGNRVLAELHHAHDLRALPALDVAADPHEPERGSAATGHGLELRWRANRLQVAHAGRGVVDRETPSTWLTADRPMCAGCDEVCTNPAYVRAAHGEATRATVVLVVGYGGTDTCWEPDSQYHVIAW